MSARRDQEYDYLAVSYQLAELLEQRARARSLLRAVNDIAAELDGLRAAGLREADDAARLIDELRSLLPLAAQAASETERFRARARLLHQRLHTLGQGLFPA